MAAAGRWKPYVNSLTLDPSLKRESEGWSKAFARPPDIGTEFTINHHRQSNAARLADHLLFSGKGYRGKGVAPAALKGAVEQIKKLGGGRIEGYPEDIEGRKAPVAFLFNGALSTFERHGFKRSRLIGKHEWVVTVRRPAV